MTEENSSSPKVHTVEVRDGRTSIPWNPETVPLSKSGIQMYDMCPYRFYLQVVCGLSASSPEMERGKYLHAQVASVYEKVNYDEIMAGNVEEQLRANLYGRDQEEEALLETFIRMQKIKFDSLKYKELFFPMTTERFLYDKKLQFYGTFDQLDGQDDNSYIVIDWKSGKYSKWNDRNLRFGMMGYIYLIEKCMDIHAREFVVFHFKDGHFFGPEVPHPSTVRAFHNRVKRTRERIKFDLTMERFKKKTNSCQFGSFYCPFYGEECLPALDEIKQVSDEKRERNVKGRML